MAGTVSVSVPVSASGPFQATTSAQLPCSVLAQAGSSGTFPLPSPGLVGTTRVDLSMTISGYHGAGTYGVDALRSASAAVTVNHDRYTLSGPGATASATIGSDASGRLSFTNLAGPTARPLSGTVTWTCRSAQAAGTAPAQPNGQP
jgi:hypothetical protein